MKRFISVSLAALLGLASAASVADPTFLQEKQDTTTTSTTATKLEDMREDLSRLNCLLYDDLTFFDLRKLEQFNPISAVSNTLESYSLSFCRRQDAKNQLTFAYRTIGNDNSESKEILTGGSKPVRVNTVDPKTDEDLPTHITFDIEGGEKCRTNNSLNYFVSYTVYCDAAVTGAPSVSVDDLTDLCNPRVSFSHAVGCPAFQATSFVRWLSNHPWVIAVFLIAFGAVTTFFGGKYFPYVLSAVAGGLTFLVLLLLASVFGFLKALDQDRDPSGGEIAITVVSFIVSAALGVFAGWFIKKIQRIGITLLGAAAGFFGGFLLYTFVFIQWLDHVAVLITLSLLGALIVGFLSWKFIKTWIVYLSAFLGSYAFIRGISLFAGKYPNELVLYGQLSSGTFEGLEWEFYAYLASMVVFGVLGVVFQYKKGYTTYEEESDGYTKIQ